MDGPAPELLWRGRLHLGDGPGVYGDASYVGLGVELPMMIRRFPDAQGNADVNLVVEAEGAGLRRPSRASSRRHPIPARRGDRTLARARTGGAPSDGRDDGDCGGPGRSGSGRPTDPSWRAPAGGHRSPTRPLRRLRACCPAPALDDALRVTGIPGITLEPRARVHLAGFTRSLGASNCVCGGGSDQHQKPNGHRVGELPWPGRSRLLQQAESFSCPVFLRDMSFLELSGETGAG